MRRVDGSDYQRVTAAVARCATGLAHRGAVRVRRDRIRQERLRPRQRRMSSALTRFVEQLRRLREDDTIKAIVLRVDSPGGSSVASDVMWRELMITRDQKPSRPLITSMSDLAASGGITSPCRHKSSSRSPGR